MGLKIKGPDEFIALSLGSISEVDSARWVLVFIDLAYGWQAGTEDQKADQYSHWIQSHPVRPWMEH